MLVSCAAEAAETYPMQASEVDLGRQVIPKHLIGKSYRELEKIVYSFGGVSFFMFFSNENVATS